MVQEMFKWPMARAMVNGQWSKRASVTNVTSCAPTDQCLMMVVKTSVLGQAGEDLFGCIVLVQVGLQAEQKILKLHLVCVCVCCVCAVCVC